MKEVNGKVYPMWNQFIDKKKEWIGGELVDYGDSMDVAMGFKPMKTKIVDITLKPNGEASAMFSIIGNDFSCGFDVSVGGIGVGKDGVLTFRGYGGHEFTITTMKEITGDK